MFSSDSSPSHHADPAICRLDAHVHLWRYTADEFGWLDGDLQPLRRDFLPDDLRAAMQQADVSGAIAVQARQTVEETEWLLHLAANDPAVRGVVGWLPIAHERFEQELEPFLADPNLVGLRHIVQAEPAGFLDGDAFNRGIHALLPTGLVYEILIYPHQMEEALRFIDRHPGQAFILDHMAKPRIAAGELSPWAEQLRELARRPNLACKISGLVTEADPARWTPQQLQRYAEVALEAFGAQRLMIGTDWPVLSVGCDYAHWWRTVESWIARLTQGEQALILGANAEHVYRLNRRFLKAGE